MTQQEGGFSPQTVLEHLKRNGVTHVVWLPDSETNFLYGVDAGRAIFRPDSAAGKARHSPPPPGCPSVAPSR